MGLFDDMHHLAALSTEVSALTECTKQLTQVSFELNETLKVLVKELQALNNNSVKPTTRQK